MESVVIKTEFIKLSQVLKLANKVGTGGEAKTIILDGLVKINNEVCIVPGKKIYNLDIIEIDEYKEKFQVYSKFDKE